MPAAGHFVPRTEQVIEKMNEYVGGNVVEWFIGNLYHAAGHALRRGVALALMVGGSMARSSKSKISLDEWLVLAKWAYENSLSKELADHDFEPPKGQPS
jgi:hypothetical protein